MGKLYWIIEVTSRQCRAAMTFNIQTGIILVTHILLTMKDTRAEWYGY